MELLDRESDVGTADSLSVVERDLPEREVKSEPSLTNSGGFEGTSAFSFEPGRGLEPLACSLRVSCSAD
jgi:hypothetical protein